jgi:DNA-directed RNA polymerase specialized sigma24 family protein
VNTVTFDSALPAARGLARLKARAAIGQCGLTPGDREDIEAQLLLALCSRLHKFDRQRSCLRTFACRVMDREVSSILRYRLAQRRLLLGRPDLVDDGGAPDQAEHETLDPLTVVWPSPVQRLEFWVDVGKVMDTLPVVLRDTVLALCCGSPTEASEELGKARSVVYERIGQIREAFLAAGVGPTYFAAGGVR